MVKSTLRAPPPGNTSEVDVQAPRVAEIQIHLVGGTSVVIDDEMNNVATAISDQAVASQRNAAGQWMTINYRLVTHAVEVG